MSRKQPLIYSATAFKRQHIYDLSCLFLLHFHGLDRQKKSPTADDNHLWAYEFPLLFSMSHSFQRSFPGPGKSVLAFPFCFYSSICPMYWLSLFACKRKNAKHFSACLTRGLVPIARATDRLLGLLFSIKLIAIFPGIRTKPKGQNRPCHLAFGICFLFFSFFFFFLLVFLLPSRLPSNAFYEFLAE